MRSQQGFTLTELLIALLILGVIATFTIPKVLAAQQGSVRKAVMLEVVSALQQSFYENAMISNRFAGKTPSAAFGQALNAVKICTSDSIAENCWSGDQVVHSSANRGGFVLHSGATVVGFHNVGGFEFSFPDDDNWHVILIDFNGSKGPNLPGEDTMAIVYCFDTTRCYNAGQSIDMRPLGMFAPSWGGHTAANRALFDSLFK